MQIGGWFGVFVAAIAYYIAFAELTNECYRKASRRPPLPARCVHWDEAFAIALQVFFRDCGCPVRLCALQRHGTFAQQEHAEALLSAQKIMPLGEMKHRFALAENNEEREDII